MRYTVKYNRTTNHIDGIDGRTVAAHDGKATGGEVPYYAENACGSLTRYSFANGFSSDSLADVLEAARKDGRKLCKTCEKAALAALEAMAAQAEKVEEKRTVTTAPIVKTGEAVSVEIGTVHPVLKRAMDANPDAGPLHTVKVGYEGKSSHAKFENDEKTLCSITGEGVSFDHTAPSCKRCIAKLKKITEGENMAATKKTAAAKPAAVDVDALTSDVHETVDQIKAIDPTEEGAATKAAELAAEAEEKIRQLPRGRQAALRKAVKAAHAVTDTRATADAKPAKKAAAAKPGNEVAVAAKPRVEVAEDFTKIEGVPDLVKTAAAKAREGVEFGLKMGSTSESVARTIFEIRTKIKNPNTGLWDVQAESKTPKNAASEVYRVAREDVADDDVTTIAAHDALVKSVANRMTDILVEWIEKFDEKDVSALGHKFPDAEKAVRENRAAIAKAEEEGTEPPAVLTPSQAVRALYEAAGTPLPLKGRTQIAREAAQAKALVSKRKELEVLAETKEEKLDEWGEDEVTAHDEKAAKLREAVTELEGKLSADVLAKADEDTPKKTRQERTFEKLTKGREVLKGALTGGAKLTDDEKRDLVAELEKLSGWLSTEIAGLKPKG
ncbi:hypothetical protein AB0N93_20995 [Streptomyces sp. NPDC091267]|uniref:hypothetical protein n=1 Tax=Streptomyces sp. NPDC091267 TaxID=3155195 RepID=UPI00342DDEB7